MKKQLEDSESFKKILQTSGELKDFLKDYPDLRISVHGSKYFRIHHDPITQIISIVGVDHK